MAQMGKREITIAIIGLVGVLAAAIIPNMHNIRTWWCMRMTTYEQDTDRVGGDYRNLKLTLSDCAKTCLNEERCQAFSYRLSSGQCWLKEAVPVMSLDKDFVSSVKYCK